MQEIPNVQAVREGVKRQRVCGDVTASPFVCTAGLGWRIRGSCWCFYDRIGTSQGTAKPFQYSLMMSRPIALDESPGVFIALILQCLNARSYVLRCQLDTAPVLAGSRNGDGVFSRHVASRRPGTGRADCSSAPAPYDRNRAGTLPGADGSAPRQNRCR